MMRAFVLPSMLCLAAVLSLTLPLVNGAAIVVDDDSVIYSIDEPLHTDLINISTKVLLLDAELDEGGVVLKHSLCTDTYCGLPETTVMTHDPSTGTYNATIGPFPAKDSSNSPFIDVRFHVEATGRPTDGTSGTLEDSSEEITLMFKEPPQNDDDDGEEEESPFPLLALTPLALSPLALRKRKRVS